MGSDGHTSRERRCVVSGEVKPAADMIRFVAGPDGHVVPDILEKLPGRGVWVRANAGLVAKAVTTQAFSRGLKRKVEASEALVGQVEYLLRRRALGLLAMGLKSAKIVIGFDQVRGHARIAPVAWRIEARDGSPDGRSKIRTLAKAVTREIGAPLPRVCGVFTMAELGKALGRERVVHAGLAPGPLAKSFGRVMHRLDGFTPLVPPDWPDRVHESIAENSGGTTVE